MWLISQDGSTQELTGATINNQNVVFADGNMIDGSPWLYLADGGYPVYTRGADLTRLGAASGAPAAVSHVCWCVSGFLYSR